MNNLNKLRVQNKIVDVNDRAGNSFIKNMQGTTKMIYDTLEVVPGQNTYNFFVDTNTRNFPFTNVKSDSLPVAESIAAQRYYLSVVTITTIVGENPRINLLSLSEALTAIPGLSALALSELALQTANDLVMKPILTANALSPFNINAQNNNCNVFEFLTDIILLPQQTFSFPLRTLPLVGASGDTTKTYLRLVIEGVGSQYSGKMNF